MAADEKIEQFVERRQRKRRSREEIVREIKLALTIGDGLLLEQGAKHAHGVDPYDSLKADKSRDPWAGRRRS